ncbi:hypothetical protein DM806_12400 [Sphingobium lactosutens]|nr:hypothetical protein [Sphingobium lactosutens]
MEIVVTCIFGVNTYCCSEFMELMLRSIIKLAYIVQPLDEYANHHQGQHRDVVGLTFNLHAALLL